MIQDKREIQIKASPETIFALIETMPNKFPSYKIIRIKPLFFLRILLVDGLRSAIKALAVDKPEDVFVLNVGDSMGPFTLTESERPYKYWFNLKSYFFNCQTGYSLSPNGSETILSLDIITEKPSTMETIYFFVIKPIHIIFANKVLRNIRDRVER